MPRKENEQERDLHSVIRALRKRQVSWDRAEKARFALTPYLQEFHENDLRLALGDFLVDLFHLAALEGFDLDRESVEVFLERSKSFFFDEEPVQHIPAFGKLGVPIGKVGPKQK